jgi:hypothetical protein
MELKIPQFFQQPLNVFTNDSFVTTELVAWVSRMLDEVQNVIESGP